MKQNDFIIKQDNDYKHAPRNGHQYFISVKLDVMDWLAKLPNFSPFQYHCICLKRSPGSKQVPYESMKFGDEEKPNGSKLIRNFFLILTRGCQKEWLQCSRLSVAARNI